VSDGAPSLKARAADAREHVLSVLEAVRSGKPVLPELLEEASKLLYEPPAGDHFLVIEEDGWAVKHPDACSEHGDPKQDCEVEVDVRAWLELQNGPPIEPGTWLVQYDAQRRKTQVVRQING
jgi:hypothetical protein